MTLLWALTGAIPLVLLVAWLVRRWQRKHGGTASASEWMARAPILGTQRPYKSVLTAEGRKVWSDKRQAFIKAPATWEEPKPGKITVVRRKA